MGIPRLSHQQQWRAAYGLQQQPSQTTRVLSKSLTSVACGVSPIHLLLAHCTYFNGLLGSLSLESSAEIAGRRRKKYLHLDHEDGDEALTHAHHHDPLRNQRDCSLWW
ncbi:unnamed protein product [Sphagnum troendelagicum]|uniref:Uncharacterized protein n=1 Tax=Sphagnum troendelagicum TaxID=128251 RepID=A0ABP0UD01_9BRYO